jgi:hypothetical protein
MKKTRIVKLPDGVDFLKGKYRLLPSGRVLRLPHPDSAKRMRRKLKKFQKLIAQGKMGFYDLRTACQSWRGNFRRRFDADGAVRRMDGLYHRLFLTTEVNYGANSLSCPQRNGDCSPHQPEGDA